MDIIRSNRINRPFSHSPSVILSLYTFTFLTAYVNIHSYLLAFLYLSATLASYSLLSGLDTKSTIAYRDYLNESAELGFIDWIIPIIWQSSLYNKEKSLNTSLSNRSLYILLANNTSLATIVFSSYLTAYF